MRETERLKIAIPNGELKDDVQKLMTNIGVSFAAVPRRYLH